MNRRRRLENPDYRRELEDGCLACNGSRTYCQAVGEYESRRCCGWCSH